MAGILNGVRQRFFHAVWGREVRRTIAAWFRHGAHGTSKTLATSHLHLLLIELVVMVGIGFLLVTDGFIGQRPAGPVMLLLAASGACLHTLRRWLNNRGNPLVSTFSERLRGTTWIAWLALAGAAWYEALHWRLVGWAKHLTQLFAGKEAAAGVEPYLAVVGLVITIVTAFYLLLLHRATDEARKAADEIRGYQQALHALEQQDEEDFRGDLLFLSRTHLALGNEVLQPMIPLLHILLTQAKLPTTESQAVLDKLQAQQSALKLLLTESPEQFVGNWDGLQASRKDLTEQVSYLSAKALRHFDLLLKDFPGELDEAEIRRLRRELRDWGRSSA